MARLCLVEMSRFPRGVHSRGLVGQARAVVVVALWALSTLLHMGPAHAQDNLEVPGYRETIAEALAEYEAQNFLEARTLFERAHKLYPNARTLRGLGVVAFELRSYSDSLSFLTQALASDRKPLQGEMRATAERLLERARAFVGELALVVTPEGSEVVVDVGSPALISKQPLALDVGPHVLEFRAKGYVPERRSYTVHGGERDTWTISLAREGAAAREPQQPSSDRPLSPWRKGVGITAVGLGAAALVAGGLLTASRHREGERYRRVGPDDGEYPGALAAWEDTRPGPYVVAGVGAVTLGGGALSLILGAQKRTLTAEIVAGASGAGGLALAVLAVVNLKRGSACSASLPDRPRCSDELEQRDRGAILALSAVPLLALSLGQLFRRWPERAQASSVSLQPWVDTSRGIVSIDLTGTFL